jgi:hypothetical protein
VPFLDNYFNLLAETWDNTGLLVGDRGQAVPSDDMFDDAATIQEP